MAKLEGYVDHRTCPAYVAHDGETPEAGQLPRWSGKDALVTPPAVASQVDVTMNGFGPSVVVGYFTENGFLGLRVRPEKRPGWHKKQSPERDVICVFGAEIQALETGKRILYLACVGCGSRLGGYQESECQNGECSLRACLQGGVEIRAAKRKAKVAK